MIKILAAVMKGNSLRAEKDIRLRIDLLEGQSSSMAKMLARAIRDHNETAFKEYAERLAANRGRVEELLWVLGEKADQSVLDRKVYQFLSYFLKVLGEKADQSVLDLQVATASGRNNNDSSLSVKEAIEKLKAGELKMDDLSPDAQAIVRKAALEMKNARKG
jgi:hypothetical protein